MRNLADTLMAFLGVVKNAEDNADKGKEGQKVVGTLMGARDLLLMWANPPFPIDNVAADLSVIVKNLSDTYAVDRTEGDALAKIVQGGIDAEQFDEDQAAMATALVERWQGTKGKRSAGGSVKGGQTDTTPDFPFPITSTCTRCNKVVVREGQRSGASRWNSLRHFTRDHEKKVHGATDFSDAEKVAWKDAKTAFKNGATDASTPGYKITRNGVVTETETTADKVA